MYGNLSLQQAPPFSVPIRFFLTAPFFGILAAMLLLFNGSEPLTSRWTAGMLAITHCLVLGFFASIMIGALQQILPVLAGAVIQKPRLIATMIHLQWIPGIVFLTTGFFYNQPLLYIAALILVNSAMLTFIVALLYSLQQTKSVNQSVSGVRLAIVSLLIALLLGAVLLLGHVDAVPLWRPHLTNLHLTWGLIGWMAMLVIAVAWQVVPMFQITPPYPGMLRRYAVSVILILLLMKSGVIWFSNQPAVNYIEIVINLGLALGLLIFAVATLNLQRLARRKIRDSHKDYWRLAMINLIFAVVLWFNAELSDSALLGLLAATVFLLGFAISVVTGMLLKIVSFLVWLHLQAARDGFSDDKKHLIRVPKMNAIISSAKGYRLMVLLILAEIFIFAAVVYPPYFYSIAACLWLLYFCYLAFILVRSIYSYTQVKEYMFSLSGG